MSGINVNIKHIFVFVILVLSSTQMQQHQLLKLQDYVNGSLKLYRVERREKEPFLSLTFTQRIIFVIIVFPG